MATPISMDVTPISSPHLGLDHLPLADKDFQINEISVHDSPLKLYSGYRDQYLNHDNKLVFGSKIHLSTKFPEVHIFPKIVHYYHANYIPSQRVVMSPN